jgi:hypothetical protein
LQLLQNPQLLRSRRFAPYLRPRMLLDERFK